MNNRLSAVTCLIILLNVLCSMPINAQWGEYGIVHLPTSGIYPLMFSNSDGTVNVVSNSGNICKVDHNGVIAWTVSAGGTWTYNGYISKDRDGATLLAWSRYEYPDTWDSCIFVQKVTSSGEKPWGDPIAIYCESDRYDNLGIRNRPVSDGKGGAIVIWQDPRGYSADAIYIQRISTTGNTMWADGGVEIDTPTSASNYFSEPYIVTDNRGGAIITWHHYKDPLDEYVEVRAQRVDSTGALRWGNNGILIGHTIGSVMASPNTTDCAGGVIIAWMSYMAPTYEMRVQKIDSSGVLAWGNEGIFLSDDNGQVIPDIGSDNNGGAYVTWPSGGNGNPGLYMQRIDEYGNKLWGESGIIIREGGGAYPKIAVGESGEYACVAWVNNIDGTAVQYAQKVDSFGNEIWTHNGIPTLGTQRYHQIAIDYAGGAYITWSGVFLRRIMSNGDIPVATELFSSSVDLIDTDVVIRWILIVVDPMATFFIKRIDESGLVEIDRMNILRNALSFSYSDVKASPGGRYKYRVFVTDSKGTRILFETEEIRIPTLTARLEQNHPNPFNPSTRIEYYLPTRAEVSLVIYDISGMLIVQLVDGVRDSGNNNVIWDGSNDKGIPVSSGTYFYKLTVGKESISKKMILLR